MGGGGQRSVRSATTCVAALLVLALFFPARVTGQGLIIAPDPVGAGDARRSLYNQLKQQMQLTADWKQKFKEAPQSTSGVTLGAAGDGMTEEALLTLASSPSTYDAADPSWSGGKRVVPAPRNQLPCQTCVAHALVAAAEAAVASVTGKDVEYELERLSVQDLHFCSSGWRDCDTGWQLKDGLDELAKRGPELLQDKCLPYVAKPRGNKNKDAICGAAQRGCSDRGSVSSQGSFDYKPLTQVWQVQKHIREFGAVVTRFDIFSDFAPYFKDARNAKAVYTPSPNANLIERHAVLLIGYSNGGGGYWIARNSWGPGFGSNGDFKVAYGAAGVLTAGDTFGIIWSTPKAGLTQQLQVAPSATAGCVEYKATSGDYLSKIASHADVPITKLVSDNAKVISDFDAPLAGKTLLICGSSLVPGGGGGGGGGGGAAPSAQQAATAAATATGEDPVAAPKSTPPPPPKSPPPPVPPPPAPKLSPPPPPPPKAAPSLATSASSDTGTPEAIAEPEAAAGGASAAADAAAPSASASAGPAADKASQLQALLAFKTAVDPRGALSSWTASAGAGGGYCKGFSGVTCDASGNVLKIAVPGTQLRGTLPAAAGTLRALPALELIDLSSSGVKGTLPADWGTLPALAAIRLESGTQLVGSIPPEWGRLTKLRLLYLHNNKLDGSLPDVGGGWANMEDFQAHNNMITGSIPKSWAKMSRMYTLNLRNNKISGPLATELAAGWSGLEDLNLSSNEVSGQLPGALLTMPKLQFLSLAGNKLTGGLPPLLGSGLEELDLSNNAGLTGQLPPDWGKSGKSLKKLVLSGNPGLTGCFPKGLDKFASSTSETDGTGLERTACA